MLWAKGSEEHEGAFRLPMSLDGKTLNLSIEVGGVAAGDWLRGRDGHQYIRSYLHFGIETLTVCSPKVLQHAKTHGALFLMQTSVQVICVRFHIILRSISP